MAERDMIPIYDGKLRANRIGTFSKGGVTFDIIRPGYDSQGRRENSWTQFVVDGIPVFEVKLQSDLSTVLDRFESEWAKYIGNDFDLLRRAIEASQKEHRSKFMDGETGLEPAPALTVDGRNSGKSYPS